MSVRRRRVLAYLLLLAVAATGMTLYWTGKRPPFHWALWPHMFAGVVGVLAGPGAMLTRKGGWWHRWWGKFYVGSMVIASTTGIPISLRLDNHLLLYLCVFTLYLPLSGYRALRRKNPAAGDRATWFDVSLSLATLATGVLMMVTLGGEDAMGIIARVFGLGLCIVTVWDLHNFIRPPAYRNFWLIEHLGKMLGGYIGAITAVSVVQLESLPTLVRWLWPLAIGLPGILIWIGYYVLKFRRAGQRAAPHPAIAVAATKPLTAA